RLSLRADNADERLTPMAMERGLVGFERKKRFQHMQQKMDAARNLSQSLTLTPNEAARHGLVLNKDGVRRTAYDLLSYPDMSLARLAEVWPELSALDLKTQERLETEARYAVYL